MPYTDVFSADASVKDKLIYGEDNTRPMAGESYSRDLEVMLGDPKRAVLVMTLPLILSYAVAQINMFADTAWCAGLGSYSSTALSSIIPYYWIISGIGTAIGIGAAATIARHLGRGESGEAESLVAQTLALSVIVGILITVPLYLSLGPLMDVMSSGRSPAIAGSTSSP